MRPQHDSILHRLRTLVVLVLIAGFLFLLPARLTAPMRVLFTEAAAPAQTAAYQGAGEALAAGGTLTDSFLARDRSRRLANELQRLRNENQALRMRMRDAAEALRSARGFRRTARPVQRLRAPVAGYSTSAVSRSVVVRAGSSHGVEPGMGATANGALVGTVTETGPWTCRVRLLTDPESVVPCWVFRPGPQGRLIDRSLWLLKGTGGPALQLEMMDQDALARETDPVVTADLGADPDLNMDLPPYVPIGRITEVRTDPMRPLFLDATVRPSVPLERLEHVEILLPGPPATDEPMP